MVLMVNFHGVCLEAFCMHEHGCPPNVMSLLRMHTAYHSINIKVDARKHSALAGAVVAWSVDTHKQLHKYLTTNLFAIALKQTTASLAAAPGLPRTALFSALSGAHASRAPCMPCNSS